jgi:hypothetical protein
MSFHDHIKLKDKLCLTYNGHNPEYLIQLKLIKPFLLEKYPGIEITFACREQYRYCIPESISIEQYNCKNFGYTIPIKFDANSGQHPILFLLKESGIVHKYNVRGPIGQNGFICPEGNFPTESLDIRQTQHLRSWVQSKGFKPCVVGTSISETRLPIDKRPLLHERLEMARTAGFVVGVECDMVYEAIGAGVPTAIVAKGNSRELYEALCVKPIILAV